MMGLSLGLAAGGFVANACFVRWKALKAIYIVFEMVSALAACMMCVRWICKSRRGGLYPAGRLTLQLADTDSLWEACAYVFVFGLGSSAASATFLVGLVQVTRADRESYTKYWTNLRRLEDLNEHRPSHHVRVEDACDRHCSPGFNNRVELDVTGHIGRLYATEPSVITSARRNREGKTTACIRSISLNQPRLELIQIAHQVLQVGP
jgi:hypothetical protein